MASSLPVQYTLLDHHTKLKNLSYYTTQYVLGTYVPYIGTYYSSSEKREVG